MKKTTLLSLFTAGAIVATTAGTYAAWDTLSTTSSGNVTLREPVAVKSGTFSALATESELDVLPTYNGTVEFTVSNAPSAGYTLTPTIVVKDGSTIIDNSKIIATVVDTHTGENVNGSHIINVSITPTDSPEAKTLGGKPLTLEVKGELKQK